MTKIPVYTHLGGIHQLLMYEETENGIFRRTADQPMRLLREHIEGIGEKVGELMANRFDRLQRFWLTPTVLYNQQPHSYYQFFREQLRQQKVYVFSRGLLSDRLTHFDMHELMLKPSVSSQINVLLTRKIAEATMLNMQHIPSEHPADASNLIL